MVIHNAVATNRNFIANFDGQDRGHQREAMSLLNSCFGPAKKGNIQATYKGIALVDGLLPLISNPHFADDLCSKKTALLRIGMNYVIKQLKQDTTDKSYGTEETLYLNKHLLETNSRQIEIRKERLASLQNPQTREEVKRGIYSNRLHCLEAHVAFFLDDSTYRESEIFNQFFQDLETFQQELRADTALSERYLTKTLARIGTAHRLAFSRFAPLEKIAQEYDRLAGKENE